MNTSNPTSRAQVPASATPRSLESLDAEDRSALQKYGPILALVLGAVGLGLLIGRVWQGMRASKNAAAWDFYQSITQDPTTSFSPANLADSMQKAKDEPLVYPWVVLSAAHFALGSGDRATLEALRPELSAVASQHALGELYTMVDGQRMLVADYLLKQVDAELQGQVALPSFANPAPTGKRVKFTIKSDSEDTYEITYGLYEEVAPEASQRLLAAVAAGSLVGKSLDPTSTGLRCAGLGQGVTDPQALPLESRWGYFRGEGAMVTQMMPAGGGKQDGDQFVVLMAEDHTQEGMTTVFGQVVDGQAALSSLQQAMPSRSDPSKAAPKLTLSAVEVLP